LPWDLDGKEAVPGSSPGEGLNTCKLPFLTITECPLEQGGARGSSRPQPQELPANWRVIRIDGAPPCSGGPRWSGPRPDDRKSLQRRKSARDCGAPNPWGQVFGRTSAPRSVSTTRARPCEQRVRTMERSWGPPIAPISSPRKSSDRELARGRQRRGVGVGTRPSAALRAR
jgi:hypothetical protein